MEINAPINIVVIIIIIIIITIIIIIKVRLLPVCSDDREGQERSDRAPLGRLSVYICVYNYVQCFSFCSLAPSLHLGRGQDEERKTTSCMLTLTARTHIREHVKDPISTPLS